MDRARPRLLTNLILSHDWAAFRAPKGQLCARVRDRYQCTTHCIYPLSRCLVVILFTTPESSQLRPSPFQGSPSPAGKGSGLRLLPLDPFTTSSIRYLLCFSLSKARSGARDIGYILNRAALSSPGLVESSAVKKARESLRWGSHKGNLHWRTRVCDVQPSQDKMISFYPLSQSLSFPAREVRGKVTVCRTGAMARPLVFSPLRARLRAPAYLHSWRRSQPGLVNPTATSGSGRLLRDRSDISRFVRRYPWLFAHNQGSYGIRYCIIAYHIIGTNISIGVWLP